jgi:hypothetical protein
MKYVRVQDLTQHHPILHKILATHPYVCPVHRLMKWQENSVDELVIYHYNVFSKAATKTEPPLAKPNKPTIQASPTNKVLAGERMTLTCNTGFLVDTATFSFKWFKGSTQLKWDGSQVYTKAAVGVSDAGVYSCTAANAAGETASDPVTINVIGKLLVQGIVQSVHDPNPPHTVYGLTIDSCSLIQFW